MTINWIATISGQLATTDLQVPLGNIHFLPGEAMKNLQLEILADDDPEIQEVNSALANM